MNQLLLFDEDLISESAALIKGRRFLHMKEILKNTEGDSLRVGLKDGNSGIAEVLSMSEDNAEISFCLNDSPPPPLDVTLVIALCRPKSMKRALYYAVSMGVKEVHIIRSYRVDKSYFLSPVISDDGIFETSLLALEQCRDTVFPEVKIHKLFKPFAEDVLPIISANKNKVLCHPYSALPFPSFISGKSVIIIGPDGGFIQYEIDLLKGIGFDCYSMGERILRTENAVAAVLSKFC